MVSWHGNRHGGAYDSDQDDSDHHDSDQQIRHSACIVHEHVTYPRFDCFINYDVISNPEFTDQLHGDNILLNIKTPDTLILHVNLVCCILNIKL